MGSRGNVRTRGVARRLPLAYTASVRFARGSASLRFAKVNWSGKSSARAPVLRVSAPQPWLVSRSRRLPASAIIAGLRVLGVANGLPLLPDLEFAILREAA